MLKKITAVVSSSKNKLVRKAAVITGVALGIGIGLLLSKDEEDLVIIGEVLTAPGESDYSVSGEIEQNASDGETDNAE